MNWLGLRIFLAGLALRIGIPVGMTVLLAWLLRRLDSRMNRAQ